MLALLALRDRHLTLVLKVLMSVSVGDKFRVVVTATLHVILYNFS